MQKQRATDAIPISYAFQASHLKFNAQQWALTDINLSISHGSW